MRIKRYHTYTLSTKEKNNFPPQAVFYLTLMRSAEVENDWDYFHSDTFKEHCDLLGTVNADAYREFLIRRNYITEEGKFE